MEGRMELFDVAKYQLPKDVDIEWETTKEKFSIFLSDRIGESAYTPYAVRKKGAEKVLQRTQNFFLQHSLFFPPSPGVRAKHAKPLSAMLECSKIKQRERRSINKCPVTFLQIKFFRLPQIA